MTAFSFEVPEAGPGAKLRLSAPDGASLLLTLLPEVTAGSTVTVTKGADGQWTSEMAKKVEVDMPQFSFTLPACSPGEKVKVPAPDGVTLLLPINEGLKPGMTITMAKGSTGQWGFVSATAPAQWKSREELDADLAEPGTALVQLNTTKGPIKIRIAPKWAPLGAQRFLEMVADGFYKDIAIYRGINGGLLQFGVVQNGDPRGKQYTSLADDLLCGVPYAEGIVGFAAAGPKTRKHTVCIMKADFRSQLGKGSIGSASTETPFGMVCPESMDVMHRITCLGDIPQCGGSGPDPHKIEEQGNAYLK
eukprot:CAMPEP_0178442770 /NCGR_PEP_ID=MMETSP0689_2-20121128/38402_1 /TAXON_ID=160604 /ORGANISM="Amphidinium massartii, Strain CS-259" /LENGTH=304 /DNA_ID=CAMNT_0020066459 /DNA_START=21 /DNA_END=932 /DNA_ORIENTATION=-